MAISIKDIARLAGVSHSTVSRALSNSPLIPASTSERIQRIARQQGYTASAVARSLVTRKTRAIGIVVTTIADPFNGDVVAGIEHIANEQGYSVILAASQADPEREVSVVRSFHERRVDGILVASSRVGARYVPLLLDLNVPIVLLNNQHPDEFAYSVGIDNIDGGFQATRYLVELGHKRIAYVGDRCGLQSDVQRFRGYKRALHLAELPLAPELITYGDGKSAEGARCAAQLLGLDNPPTAIFCYNDMTALGVLQEACRRGFCVPRDVSVVGFDDLFFASLLHPSLTTIQQPREMLGRRAMEILLSLLDSQTAEKAAKFKGQLMPRESTAPPATNRLKRGKTRQPDPDNRA